MRHILIDRSGPGPRFTQRTEVCQWQEPSPPPLYHGSRVGNLASSCGWDVRRRRPFLLPPRMRSCEAFAPLVRDSILSRLHKRLDHAQAKTRIKPISVIRATTSTMRPTCLREFHLPAKGVDKPTSGGIAELFLGEKNSSALARAGDRFDRIHRTRP